MNGFKKLMEVFCLILEFREEKRAFAKIEGGNVDFLFFFHLMYFSPSGPAWVQT
jgi:hypothetical protein